VGRRFLTFKSYQCVRRASRSAAFLLGLALAGCSLASEQLKLPDPVLGAAGATGSIAGGTRKGVGLGDPADPATTANRAYPGTGQFTKTAAGQASGGQPSSGQGEPRGLASKTISGEGISLELVGASIPDAAKAVLGDVLNVTYIVSDKAKGTVTLKTSRPVSRDGLLEIFESVLATEGLALVVDGPIFRIMPREDALAEGRPIKAEQNFSSRTPGQSTEIVPLKNVSATEMERILKSVAPQSTIRHVDTARNLLVISGSRAELQSMADVVSVFDVDWMRGMSFGIFPLETGEVEAVAQELDKIFANDQGGSGKGLVRFIPNARLKSILVITQRPEYLKKAETWIRRIDMASEATDKRAFVYHVQHRSSQELAELLKKVYSPSGEGSRSQDGSGQPGLVTGSTASATEPVPAPAPGFSADQTRPLAANEPRPIGPAVATAGAAKLANTQVSASPVDGGDGSGVSAVGANLSASLARPLPDDRNSGISVVADEGNNTLVITATPSEIRRIRQVLQQVDVLPEQVLLEATIAEVTLNDDLKFGMRWFFEKGASELRLTDSVIGAIAPVFPGFSYFVNTPNVKVVLNALSGITHVNLVSSPSLMTLNNKRATLQIGDEVPIATQSAVSVITPGAPIVNSIAFRNTGVILNITPRVADNGQVLLEIEQEVSDVKATTSSNIDSPTIQQRRIKTTVAVNSGGSVVLAGLMRDKATRKNNQVPLLGDIPLVGNLFKDKDDLIERTELLIAITPQVIKDNAQIGLVASEFRDRMNFTTRPQRETPPDHRETLDRLVR
jgi:general secretion pathway protein D